MMRDEDHGRNNDYLNDFHGRKIDHAIRRHREEFLSE